MAKKNKDVAVEKKKKSKQTTLSEREKTLVATSVGQKKFRRKDVIIATIITVIIVVILVAGSTVAAKFIGKRLKDGDVYSYTLVTEYLAANEIACTPRTDLVNQTDGAVASIVVGSMEIRYFAGGSDMAAYTKVYKNVENIYHGQLASSCEAEDSKHFIIIGTNTDEYKDYFEYAID